MERIDLPDEIEESIEKMREEFRENPTEYLVESSVQYKFVQILRENFDEKIDAKVLNWKEDPPEYKKAYIASLEEGNTISQVKGEVNVGKGSGESDELIDVCVFKEKEKISIEYDGGSKYFHREEEREGILAAIEIKFVKNDNLPGSVWENPENRRKENAKLISSPEEIEDTSKQFHKDIKKLNRVKAENKILLVFSNKNIFQQPSDPEKKWTETAEDDEYQRKAIRRLKNLKGVLGGEIALRETHLEKTASNGS